MTRASSYADRIKPDKDALPVPGTARGTATRARILEACEAVFGELGYNDASIVAITQRAGVAQGSFYTYFPSKHAAFVELIRSALGEVRRAIATTVGAAPTPLTRAAVDRIGCEVSFEFFLARPAIFSLLHEARVVAPDVYDWWSTTFAAAYAENFERLSGPPPADFDVETIAHILMGVNDMLIQRWIIREGVLPPSHVVDQVFAILGGGLASVLEHGHSQLGTAGTSVAPSR